MKDFSSIFGVTGEVKNSVLVVILFRILSHALSMHWFVIMYGNIVPEFFSQIVIKQKHIYI